MTDTFDPVELDKTADAMNVPDRGRYSPAEWAARVELAALYRAIDLYGMSDLVNGAIGARVPDQPDHYLTHPYGMFWDEATASTFITVRPDGTPVHDDKRWTNDGAVSLCRWIFGARPDINVFIHGHEVPIAAVGSGPPNGRACSANCSANAPAGTNEGWFDAARLAAAHTRLRLLPLRCTGGTPPAGIS